MLKIVFTTLFSLLCLSNQALVACTSQSQKAQSENQNQDTKKISLNDIKFDTKVYDFGTVSLADGPLSCSFNLINESEEDFQIYVAVSSCGCTEVSWTRDVIPPGGKGEVKATFSNDEGPYPFDKAITVYTSADKKPVILHLKGDVVSEKKKKK